VIEKVHLVDEARVCSTLALRLWVGALDDFSKSIKFDSDIWVVGLAKNSFTFVIGRCRAALHPGVHLSEDEV